ncbi:unnamed protein product [Symbiodinium natans]|uniref:Pseudouridine synthase RsuA/RluA-like domain-containing protein n=1 Tax=Symbiodinium natans TaxID=878477 RepID=A0A812NGJ2_9DINO|nr:unnamed protein product [Symbiodinium natans]
MDSPHGGQDDSPVEKLPAQCPLHLVFPDVVRCDSCKENCKDLPDEGKAPLPGLKQPFPVTALQSNTRLDVMEHQSPDGMLEKYQRFEDEHGKYKFARSRQQDALEVERRKLQLQRERTNKAKHEADHAAQDVQWQIADAERSVEEMRSRRDADMQALEVHVRQADIMLEEAQREARKRLEEAQGLKLAEEAHVVSAAQLLNTACERSQAAEERYQKLKEESQARLAARAQALAEAELAVAAQEEEAKQKAAEYLQDVKEQCEAQLEALRAQAAEIKEAVSQRLPMESRRTAAAKEATETRRHDARERLQKERQTAGVHTTVMEEDCTCMVRRVELREEATRRRLEEFTEGPVTALERTAQLWHGQSDRKSVCDKVSLEQTAWVLGHHFKSRPRALPAYIPVGIRVHMAYASWCRWNYTPSVDDKVTNILQGFTKLTAHLMLCFAFFPIQQLLLPASGVLELMAFVQPCFPVLETRIVNRGRHQQFADDLLPSRLRKLRVELRSNLDDRKSSNVIEDIRPTGSPSPEATIEALLANGQTEDAHALVEEMVTNTVTPSSSSYGRVIHTCSKEGLVDKAAILLAKIRAMEMAPDVTSYGSVIDGFAKAGRPEDIQALMGDMDEDGVPVDVVMHNGMLQALLKSGRVDDAFDWLVSMMAPQAEASNGSRRRETRPNIWSYGLVTKALAKQGRPGAVSSLLKTMGEMSVEPSIRIHDSILRGLLSARKRAEAYRWLRQVVRSGLDYDAQFVTLALEVCMQNGSFAEAFAWLNGMEEAGIDPPSGGRGAVSFFVKAVTVCAKAGKLAEGLAWLERAGAADVNSMADDDEDGRKQPGPRGIPLRPAYIALMKAFARARSRQQANDLLVQLEADEGRVDLMARTTLVEEFASCDSPEDARQLTKKLEEDGHLTVHVFGRVISACAKAGKADEAIRWFDNMVTAAIEPDAIAWNSIINACARVGRVTEAEMWLGEMDASGITPDVISYTTVINACAQSGRPQEVGYASLIECPQIGATLRNHAEVIFKICGRCGQAKEAHLWAHSGLPGPQVPDITSLAKKKKWRQALQLLHHASSSWAQADLVSFNAAINAAGKCKLWETALSVLADIDREHLQKDLFSYNTSLSASAAAAHWRWSLHLLHDSKERQLQRDLISFNTSIDGFQGAWNLSLTVLADMSSQTLQPDVITFDTAISASEKGSLWDRAFDSLGALEDRSLQADTIGLSASISTCEGERWESALVLLDKLHASALCGTTITYNAAVGSSSSGQHWQTAFEVALEFTRRAVRRSLVSFNTSITACERAAAWTKAFTMYHIVRETRWNPNVITYGATASALEKGRQWQLATIVLHQLLASGTRPNLINCNAVVSACEKSAKWQHALLIASQLTDLQLQPLLPSCNKVLGKAVLDPIEVVAVGRVVNVTSWEPFHRALVRQHLGAQGMQQNVVTYGAAMSACGLQFQWRLALGMLRRLDEALLESNEILLGAATAHAAPWTDIMHLWEDTLLWLQGQVVARLATTKTYNIAISACGKGASWPAALACFGELLLRDLQPDVVTYNSAITACTHGSGWPTSLALLHELQTRQVTPDVFTLSAAEPAGKWELATCFLHDFSSLGVEWTTLVYNAGISVFSKAAEWQRAMDLFAGMGEAGLRCSEVSYNTAIAACSRGKQWLLAVALLRLMRKRLLRTETISYNAAMGTMGEGFGSWEVALCLLAELQECWMKPSIVTYGSLINSCAKDEQWQRALLFFEEAQRSNLQMSVITYTAAISSCEKGSQWQLALFCLFDCSRRDMMPDIMSFNTAITACGNVDDLRRARLLHMILKRRQISENLSTFNALIVSHGRATQWQQALQYLANLEALDFQPDAVTFNAASGACAKSDKWQCALQLLQQAQHALLEPDNVTHGTEISAIGRAGRWPQILLLLARLDAEDQVPDVIVYNAAITAITACGDAWDAWQVCLRLLANLQKNNLTADARTFTSLITACRGASAWQPALHLLSTLRGSECSGTDMSYCYNAAISTCGRADQWQVVIDILRSMAEDALEPDIKGYDPALAAVVSSGEQDQALELLWSCEASLPAVSFLWSLAAVGVSDPEVINEACVEVALTRCHGEDLPRVLWSMEMLGVESTAFWRCTSQQFLKELHKAGLDELAMTVSGLISASSEPFAADPIQRQAEDQLRMLRQNAPSQLAFHRLGISAMGILGSFSNTGRLRQSFRTAVCEALMEVGREFDQSSRQSFRTSVPYQPPLEKLPTSVVWDSVDRAVLFKPPGWEVYGAHTQWQLSSFAASRFGSLRILDDASHNSGFLHRLDVPSSGLIMVAKTYAAFYDLQLQLHLGTFGREYTALVHGWLAPSRIAVSTKVRSGSKGPTVSGGRGKWSQTRFQCLGRKWHRAGSLGHLLLQIVTGRKHQIRSHMAYIGHPTVRDGLYTSNVTFQEDAALCDRNWLHRHLLKFRDPDGRPHEIQSPLPPDLQTSLQSVHTVRNPKQPCP